MPPLSSPSACFPFVPLASGSGYSASCSSFQPSIGSASQWLSQRPDPFFRPDQIFPVPCAWFPVRISRFCLFSFPVCSLSLFPASLPQPFHRCSSFLPVLPVHPLVRPCVRSLRFHPASFPPQSFRFAPVRLGLRYSISASSFPCFKLPPHSGFHSAVPPSVHLSVPFRPPARLFQPSFPPVFRSGSTLSASSQSLPSLRSPPSLPFPPSPFGSFGPFRSGFGTRFCCSSFHRSRFRLTAATSFRLPSLSGSGPPLSFLLHLRFLRFRLSSASLRSFPSFSPLRPP